MSVAPPVDGAVTVCYFVLKFFKGQTFCLRAGNSEKLIFDKHFIWIQTSAAVSGFKFNFIKTLYKLIKVNIFIFKYIWLTASFLHELLSVWDLVQAGAAGSHRPHTQTWFFFQTLFLQFGFSDFISLSRDGLTAQPITAQITETHRPTAALGTKTNHVRY